ncbi:MAG: hypothetical protein A2Y61_06180 [Chloroflexi bacterium RBG_13_60_13]|nr:MAG: hypothetical protein A2Y61_06180 [Chloroflexi bacterium RBG_13_60_13]
MSAPSANDLLSELKFGEYLPEDTPRLREEREAIEAAAGVAITSMAEVPTAHRAHVEKVQEFLAVLWKKYDCDDLMEVVRAYTKVEPILLDLERDEAAGGRYRDHSVHSFNVFIFGLRLLSKLIDALGSERAERSLKVRPERIHERIAGFRDWSYRERLFYLWTLMSTFHDIAIPLEHLGKVSDGLNEFARKFSLQIVGPTLHRDGLYPGLDDYFRRLGAIFKGKVTPDEAGLAYDQAHDDPYVERYLRKKFEDNDHGVLSGLLLYRKVEEIFMLLRGRRIPGNRDIRPLRQVHPAARYSAGILGDVCAQPEAR